MRKLLIYLGDYKKESILAPLFKLLESLMDLFVPLAVAAIINKGIAGNNNGVIIRYFLLLIALAALGIGFSFTAQWMAARASVGFATRIRQVLFDHIQRLTCQELDSLGTDTLITRLTSDINQIQNGVNMTLRLVLRSPFIVFGAMAMAFMIDTRCAMLFAAAIPLLGLVVGGIMAVSIPLFARVQSELDRLLGMTRENLTGVRVIRAFRKEKDEIEEFDRRNDLLTRMNEMVGRLSALMNPATYLIINAATILLIRQGAIRVQIGALKQGDVVALYNYMAQIVVELVKLASFIVTLNRGVACGRRVQAVLDVQPSMSYPDGLSSDVQAGSGYPDRLPSDMQDGSGYPDGLPSGVQDGFGRRENSHRDTHTAAAVRFRHVSFSYASSGDEVLTDIDFTAGKGQTIGIIGGTGSGKSTLVSLISRSYDVSAGCVEVDGIDVRSYPQAMLTGKIGIVPQKAVLFEGSIRDNLLWGNENADDEELWAAIETAQAADVVRSKEGGLDARVDQGGRNLSGGQRQRLTIARALVKKPEILILDDSASALDFATDLALRRAIASLPGKMTVFIISQRTSSVRQADMILVLDDGRLAGIGTHSQLMKQCDVYQEIYYSQFPEDKQKATAGTAYNEAVKINEGSEPDKTDKSGKISGSGKNSEHCKNNESGKDGASGKDDRSGTDGKTSVRKAHGRRL